jgi:bifunctional DNase/RNase
MVMSGNCRCQVVFRQTGDTLLPVNNGRFADLVVQGIALDERSQLPVILLNEPVRDRTLPVQIGPFEASAIIMELEGIHPPRPLTHDLFAAFFSKHRFEMMNLTITGLLGDRAAAHVEYRKGIRRYSMDVRPSDGFALAIRLGAQIRCETTVLDEMSVDPTFIERLLPFTPDEPAVQH